MIMILFVNSVLLDVRLATASLTALVVLPSLSPTQMGPAHVLPKHSSLQVLTIYSSVRTALLFVRNVQQVWSVKFANKMLSSSMVSVAVLMDSITTKTVENALDVLKVAVNVHSKVVKHVYLLWFSQ